MLWQGVGEICTASKCKLDKEVCGSALRYSSNDFLPQFDLEYISLAIIIVRVCTPWHTPSSRSLLPYWVAEPWRLASLEMEAVTARVRVRVPVLGPTSKTFWNTSAASVTLRCGPGTLRVKVSPNQALDMVNQAFAKLDLELPRIRVVPACQASNIPTLATASLPYIMTDLRYRRSLCRTRRHVIHWSVIHPVIVAHAFSIDARVPRILAIL